MQAATGTEHTNEGANVLKGFDTEGAVAVAAARRAAAEAVAAEKDRRAALDSLKLAAQQAQVRTPLYVSPCVNFSQYLQ